MKAFIVCGILISGIAACQTAKQPTEAEQPAPPPSGMLDSQTPISTETLPEGPQAGDELSPIYFGYDSAMITRTAHGTLKNNAEQLQSNAKSSIQIEGHCDVRGSDEYNFLLGERRAQAAKGALIKLGIDSARIKIISYGKDKATSARSESDRAKDRRASFVFLHQ